MTTISIPATNTVATAGVNVSTTTVVNALIGNLTSAAVAFGAPILAVTQGTTWGHWAIGGLLGLAGLGSLITNTWGFINHNSSASNNTLDTIAALTNSVNQVLAATQALQQPAQPSPVNSASG